MSYKKISQLINNILQEMNLNKNLKNLQSNIDLLEKGIVDSMDLVNLILAIEKKTGILLELNDETFLNTKNKKISISVDKISRFILKKSNAISKDC